MSAYGHQMEQMYSARSLSGGSEMRSNHVMESGFYITSFAATIFVTALVTIGILVITLLIALAMMLQSCQNTNDGAIELQNTKDDYSYCKFHSLYAALNNLEEQHNLPNICRNLAIEYIKGGQYAKDLDLAKSLIEDYFDKVRPKDDGLDVVLIEIDGNFPLNPHPSNLFLRFHDSSISNCVRGKEFKKCACFNIMQESSSCWMAYNSVIKRARNTQKCHRRPPHLGWIRRLVFLDDER